MHRLPRGILGCLLIVTGSLAAAEAWAKDYFVATTGNDSNAGTLQQPFATLQKGIDVAVAGDTVYIRGGVYMITSGASSAGITFSKSGTSDTSRIRYWGYQSEKPVFDFSQLPIASDGLTGFLVSGSWLHFKELEVRNVGMASRSSTGVGVRGHNDIFETLDIHNIAGSGLFIHAGDASNGGHLILNCDSHDNYDPNSDQGDGQNSDGFGVHYQIGGPSTTLRGCRAWNNSDDGYDFISQEVPVTIEWSFATGNGRGADGNGNGFKIGSSKTGIRHIVRNNVAWKNKAAGFYANHSSGGNTWLNNTSYMNGTQYNMLASTWDAGGNRTDGVILTDAKAHRMRNNIGFPNKNSNMEGVDSASNTWDLGITETAAAFEGTSDTGCLGPREADGSIPSACVFLRLKSGSPLIDKGTNVQLPYVGAAPDLGAYEFGASPNSGGGGGGPVGTDAGGSGNGNGGTTGASGGTTVGGGSGRMIGGGPGGDDATGGSGTGAMVGSGGRPIGTGGAGQSGGAVGNGGRVGQATGDSRGQVTDGRAGGCACALARDDRGVAFDGGLLLVAMFAAVTARRRTR
jgi:hypothetical protein